MSVQTMKRNMSTNQRDNRLKLAKYSTTYNKVEKENNIQDLQNKVEANTQNTLVNRISTTWFEKTKAERSIVNTAKTIFKHTKNNSLKNEFISIIVKSNPRFNIKLII